MSDTPAPIIVAPLAAAPPADLCPCGGTAGALVQRVAELEQLLMVRTQERDLARRVLDQQLQAAQQGSTEQDAVLSAQFRALAGMMQRVVTEMEERAVILVGRNAALEQQLLERTAALDMALTMTRRRQRRADKDFDPWFVVGPCNVQVETRGVTES